MANFSIFVAKFGDIRVKIWQNLGFQMAIFHDASLVLFDTFIYQVLFSSVGWESIEMK